MKLVRDLESVRSRLRSLLLSDNFSAPLSALRRS